MPNFRTLGTANDDMGLENSLSGSTAAIPVLSNDRPGYNTLWSLFASRGPENVEFIGK